MARQVARKTISEVHATFGKKLQLGRHSSRRNRRSDTTIAAATNMMQPITIRPAVNEPV